MGELGSRRVSETYVMSETNALVCFEADYQPYYVLE